jgi:putative MATE family efflux protein
LDSQLFSYKYIWKISYPIVIGLVAQNVMLVIDTAFLGRVSEVTLGAAAIGGVFYLCMIMLGTGFALGAQIMIGRRNGQGKYHEIGVLFDNAQYVLVILAALIWLFLKYPAPKLLEYFVSSEAVLKESIRFLEYRKYGLLFGFIVLGFNALYIGNTMTRVLSLSTFVMATVNIILDYVLIFGHYGFPEMGISGAALATNIAEIVTFVFYLLWAIFSGDNKKYDLFRFPRPVRDLQQRLLGISVPVMFQYFFSFSAWFVFFLIIEQIGETALAASNIARSIYMVLMIPVWGLSASINTMVSNIIGQGKTEMVIPLIKKVLFIGLISNVIIVQALIFIPWPLVSFYTENPGLIETTIPLLRVISVALMAFAFGMIFFNGLSGTGKTLLALKIEIISITIYLLSTLFMATILKASVDVVWMVEIIYFSIMGLMAWIVLERGKWKEFKI